jgi:hypothetical protein
MEGLLRAVFIVQIVATAVLTLSVVWLVVHALRSSEQLAALNRDPGPAAAGGTDPKLTAALEQVVADLGKLNASLEGLPLAVDELREAFSTGVPAVAARSVSEWGGKVAQELKQFRVLWTAFYGGKHERLQPEFLADLQDSARGTADNLLALLAARPEGERTPAQSALLAVVMSLQELAELEVDPEDSRTMDDLDDLGGRVVSQIDSLR